MAIKKKGRWRRRLLIAGLSSFMGIIGLWIAVHRIPWLGPTIADSMRSVIGVEAVTDLEDFAYGIQDRWNRFSRSEEKPKAYWKVPLKRTTPLEGEVLSPTCIVGAFEPNKSGPVHDSWSAPGDGQWVPIDDPRSDSPPVMYKTLLHPDRLRSWAAVSIVAIDRRRVKLHMMAGRYEPRSATKEGFSYERRARVPSDHQRVLLAAFNGGFKAEHGHYGMRVDGVTIIKPRPRACMIAMFDNDQLKIGDNKKLKERAEKAVWWRQTPACMVEDGNLHPGLVSDKNTYWGATLDGDTVIRRSAIGLSADGETLYSGIGDHTTARAIAIAMKHAGAADVAQLDVNWSYPKFVIYRPREGKNGELIATKLCDGFEFSEDEYIRDQAARDFFYLTERGNSEVAKRVCGEELNLEYPDAETRNGSPLGSQAQGG